MMIRKKRREPIEWEQCLKLATNGTWAVERPTVPESQLHAFNMGNSIDSIQNGEKYHTWSQAYEIHLISYGCFNNLTIVSLPSQCLILSAIFIFIH